MSRFLTGSRDRRQVRRARPRVEGTTGGSVIHGTTRGEDLARGRGLQIVEYWTVMSKAGTGVIRIAPRLLLHRLERPRRGVQVRLHLGREPAGRRGQRPSPTQGKDIVGDNLGQRGVTRVGDP